MQSDTARSSPSLSLFFSLYRHCNYLSIPFHETGSTPGSTMCAHPSGSRGCGNQDGYIAQLPMSVCPGGVSHPRELMTSNGYCNVAGQLTVTAVTVSMCRACQWPQGADRDTEMTSKCVEGEVGRNAGGGVDGREWAWRPVIFVLDVSRRQVSGLPVLALMCRLTGRGVLVNRMCAIFLSGAVKADGCLSVCQKLPHSSAILPLRSPSL